MGSYLSGQVPVTQQSQPQIYGQGYGYGQYPPIGQGGIPTADFASYFGGSGYNFGLDDKYSAILGSDINKPLFSPLGNNPFIGPQYNQPLFAGGQVIGQNGQLPTSRQAMQGLSLADYQALDTAMRTYGIK